MNNKMAKNTNLSTIEPKKQTKQTRSAETESWMFARWGGVFGGMGEELMVLKSKNR